MAPYILRRVLPNGDYKPGHGILPPQKVNNKAFFALFALLGVAMVLGSIWFFFWAKNGGFIWKRNDWDDYKSTVLRRKGPDGRTLTNATPVTNLGQKSIAGTFDIDHSPEMTQVKDFAGRGGARTGPGNFRRETSDDDVRAYRHERVAKVGGLNRQHDGSHWDLSNTDRSEIVSNDSRTQLNPKPAPAPKRGFMEKKREKRQERQKKKATPGDARREIPVTNGLNDYSKRAAELRHPVSDTGESAADSANRYGSAGGSRESYLNAYRPQTAAQAAFPARQSPRSKGNGGMPQRQSSPQKRQARPRAPGAFDTQSETGSNDTGTKSYSHHIPGLSRGSKDTGFRRDGYGARRDSLSESD